jgi:hypothetical protein
VESEDKKFKTPEEVAAEEQPSEPPVDAGAPGAEDASLEPKEDPPKSRLSKWNAFNRLNWPPGKKEWITAAVIVLLLIGGGVAYALTHKKPVTLQPIPKVTDVSKTVPSTLTGLPVDPSVNKHTVTGVMIENSLWARPQSGLGQAGVVFEAIAEAGITRFLALYQDTAPKNVGPIRSARPYFIEWNQAFDAGYAHVGGSPEALADIPRWHVRDLNQFYNADFYHRISSRAAPHNVYTGIPTLNQLEVNKGYKTSHFTGFARKPKAFRPKNQPITAKNINLAISSADYHVHYVFDSKTDSYLRYEGGAKHIDANTHKQIKPVVVIAMVMPYRLESDGYHSDYGVIGKGPAYIFQNGGVIKGTWIKKSREAQLTFVDAKGKTIQLNPGITWLTAMAASNQITYSPH